MIYPGGHCKITAGFGGITADFRCNDTCNVEAIASGLRTFYGHQKFQLLQ
jgi:hypothetical protein